MASSTADASIRCRSTRRSPSCVEVLPAFSYLHAAGLLYCDFKPANLIQVGDSIKLIDLGGVRRIGDDVSPIYGTVGFQAPEVPTEGTTIASRHLHDRPHAGRARLRVQGLPEPVRALAARPGSVPVFAAARLAVPAAARRGRRPSPRTGSRSADELREQLLGVLREVTVEPDVGAFGSMPSSLFETPVVATDDARRGPSCPGSAPIPTTR